MRRIVEVTNERFRLLGRTGVLIPVLCFLLSANSFAQVLRFDEQLVDQLSTDLKALSVEDRKAMLFEHHGQVMQLPHSAEYIHRHIFPELRKERKTVAPNFPERCGDTERDKQNLNEWLANHPVELAYYLLFVADKISYYKREEPK